MSKLKSNDASLKCPICRGDKLVPFSDPDKVLKWQCLGCGGFVAKFLEAEAEAERFPEELLYEKLAGPTILEALERVTGERDAAIKVVKYFESYLAVKGRPTGGTDWLELARRAALEIHTNHPHLFKTESDS